MEQNAVKPARWSLNDLLAEPIDQTLAEIFSKQEQAMLEFEATREWLTPEISPDDFNKILKLLENVNTLQSRIEGYGFLLLSEDTQNPAALNVNDRVDQVLTDINNRAIFFELWFKELSDEAAQRLMEHSGDLRYFLETMRLSKPFTLSELEERTINLKDVNGIEALVNLYDMITDHFAFTLEIEGKTETLTGDQLSSYFQNPSPEVRANAYREYYRVYGENSTVLAQMYIHRVRDWHTEGVQMRGFSSPIAVQNVMTDLPDEVVNTLLSVCRKNAGVFQRYFKLKAGWLDLSSGTLRRYDIYAPLRSAEKKFDYATAKQMVLDSYRAFSPDLADLAQRVFDENHIDSEIRPGKRGGAFCYPPIPELTPWVLINYAGTARDVSTLAHELGHAVHALLANGHSVLTQPASLPLAETSSIFAEMQLTDQLLKQEKDPSVRRELLANALDGAYATVMRQAYFTIFERDAHELINANGSFDELTDQYLSNLREQFGDAVEVSDEFKWEWITISHIYQVPFYTYAYSFGQLLVMSLYQQYRLEGETFIPKYIKILSYGGSASPAKILSEAGLDIASPAFWQGGFEAIKSMIAELEQLS